MIYRIAQESLTNVARHSGASHVDLSLERTDRGIELHVVDDGRGMARWDGSGHGIAGMRERALSVGAALFVGEHDGGGVEVVLELPAETAS